MQFIYCIGFQFALNISTYINICLACRSSSQCMHIQILTKTIISNRVVWIKLDSNRKPLAYLARSTINCSKIITQGIFQNKQQSMVTLTSDYSSTTFWVCQCNTMFQEVCVEPEDKHPLLGNKNVYIYIYIYFFKSRSIVWKKCIIFKKSQHSVLKRFE